MNLTKLVFLSVSLFLFFGLNAFKPGHSASEKNAMLVPDTDDGSWMALGTGITPDGVIYALASDRQGKVYIGGTFIEAGGNPAQNIAVWDGISWSGLSSGINGVILAIAVSPNNEVFAAGSLSSAGGKPVNNIAVWDGEGWKEIPGTNYQVRDLEFDNNGVLHVAGEFTVAGGITVNGIARWDGCRWHSLGQGVNGDIYSIDFDSNNNLYAGGNFTLAGGIVVNRIAKWDGTNWTDLGSGTNHKVMSVLVDDADNLIIGGYFGSVSGISANGVAKWDGANWMPLGNGFGASVHSLSKDIYGNIYAGGGFWNIYNNPNRIAKWNGVNWLSMDSGTNDIVRAVLVTANDEIYIGGQFSMASEIEVNNVAIYHPTSIIAAEALNVDGVNDHMAVIDHDSIDFGPQEDFTVELWVKIPSGPQVDLSSTGNTILEKWNGSFIGYPYAIRYLNQNNQYAGKIRVGRFDGITAPSLTSTRAVNDNKWHHIAFVKKESLLYLFIDGTLEASGNDSTIGETANSFPLTLGCRGNNTVFFTGEIDELRIWRRALCEEEIKLYKDCEINPSSRPSLGGYFRFNNEGGTETGDQIVPNIALPFFEGLLKNFALTGPFSNWVFPGAVSIDVECIETDTCNQGSAIPFSAQVDTGKLQYALEKNLSIGQQPGVKIYPNPAKETLNLQFDNKLLPVQKVIIFQSNGIPIWQSAKIIEVPNFEIQLQKYQFTKGFYVVKVEGANGDYFHRFIKQ